MLKLLLDLVRFPDDKSLFLQAIIAPRSSELESTWTRSLRPNYRAFVLDWRQACRAPFVRVTSAHEDASLPAATCGSCD